MTKTNAAWQRWERFQAIMNAVACLKVGDLDSEFGPGEREQALAMLEAEGAAIVREELDAHPETFKKFADGKYALRERLIRDTLKADVEKPQCSPPASTASTFVGRRCRGGRAKYLRTPSQLRRF
jgi:hypothetical protein